MHTSIVYLYHIYDKSVRTSKVFRTTKRSLWAGARPGPCRWSPARGRAIIIRRRRILIISITNTNTNSNINTTNNNNNNHHHHHHHTNNTNNTNNTTNHDKPRPGPCWWSPARGRRACRWSARSRKWEYRKYNMCLSNTHKTELIHCNLIYQID